MMKETTQSRMEMELKILLDSCGDHERPEVEKDFDGFKKVFKKFLKSSETSVDWTKIQKMPEGTIRDYKTLSGHSTPDCQFIKDLLGKLVVVKLNGGLGTSMGCRVPKAFISVRNNLSFLDLTIQQIDEVNRKYNADVPLVLVNSFYTNKDTDKVIKKYAGMNVKIYSYNKSRYPRIDKDTLIPIAKSCNTEDNVDAWYPPGHGDFYLSFYNSGLLEMFFKEGREFCFISNVDNLGATVDMNILSLLVNETPKVSFIMEVTDKTKADVKGGTLIEYGNQLQLLELAEVPPNRVEDFKSPEKFPFFNTNNLWMNLISIKKLVEEDNLDMEVIVNHKTLDNGQNVIQLETAVGSAIKGFDGCLGLNVPRNRFLPVKKTSDLFLIMSNLYSINKGTLLLNSLRLVSTLPHVNLDDNYFAKVSEFLRRFQTIPDILHLNHLTVSGDVTFGRDVVLKGSVIIVANTGNPLYIPDNAHIENKIVKGTLEFLEF